PSDSFSVPSSTPFRVPSGINRTPYTRVYRAMSGSYRVCGTERPVGVAGREGPPSQPGDPTRAFDRLFERGHLVVELLLVDDLQHLADAWPRFHPELEHVAAEQNRRRRFVLDPERARAREEPVHRRAIEGAGAAAFAVGLRDARQQLEIDLLRKTPERAVAHLVARLEPGAGLEMLCRDSEHLFADVVAIDRVDVQPVE